MCSPLESPVTPPNLLLGSQAGSSYCSSLEARNLSLLFSLVLASKLLFHPGDTIFEGFFFPFSFLPQCPCPSSMSSPQGCSTSLLTGDPTHIHSSNSNSLHMGAGEPSHAHQISHSLPVAPPSFYSVSHKYLFTAYEVQVLF